MTTFPGSQIWFQLVNYNVSDKVAVMAATVEVQEAMLEDNRIGLFVSDNQGSFTVGTLYRGSTNPPSSTFQAFDDITPLSILIPPTNGTFESCAIDLNYPNGQM